MIDYKSIFAETKKRNIAISLVLIVVMLTALTGATQAWFISETAMPANIFTAGTVKLSEPEIKSVTTLSVVPESNFAFVPNSDEASVSKVDLVNNVEVARYSTIPERPGIYNLADYRVARMAIDSNGNAWVLNTMTGSSFGSYGTAQGSVARISANAVSGETPGTTTSNTGGIGGIVMPDVRVAYMNLGNPGDGPRTINIVEEGGEVYLWIGYHLGKYYQKYKYESGSLVEVGNPIDIAPYTPYSSALDNYGMMWVSSRNANPYPTVGKPGVILFNTNNLGAGYTTLTYDLPNTDDDNPYAIKVTSDGKVWVSDGGNWNTNRERHFAVYTPGNLEPIYVLSGSSQAMRGFIEYNNAIWATTIDGRVLKGIDTGGNWSFGTEISGLGELAGIGADAFGKLWIIRLGQNMITGFVPSDIGNKVNITVGLKPYAYDSFTRPGTTCKTIEWEFKNMGSKKVYLRVKPLVEASGAAVTLCSECSATWQPGTDGWWYYGTTAGPTQVSSVENENIIKVCFQYCYSGDDNYTISTSLEAEAVQWSNMAIDNTWGGSHPW